MTTPWNLESSEWSKVLAGEATLDEAAASVVKGESLPWTEILLGASAENATTLDLGSGRGEHSATLALRGRRTTLVDWSAGNVEFSSRLFRKVGANGKFCQADITKPLPFHDGAFDLVFSCGVFEYFTGEQIESILREAFRVSRGSVVIMVPNALSAAYRLGMWWMKQRGRWYWGGEVPSTTLKPRFRAAGFRQIREFSVAPRHSLSFLTMPLGSLARRAVLKLFGPTDTSRPAPLRQGYLLVTLGSKLAS